MKPLRRADGTLETGLIRHHMDPWDTGDPRIDRYDDQDTATSDMLALLDEVDAMRNRIADLERALAEARGGPDPSEEPAPGAAGVVSTWRKRPALVEAAQLTGETAHDLAVYQWVEALTLGSFEPLEVLEGRAPVPASGISIDPATGHFLIATPEGLMHAPLGWWIIRGVAGEFYPCDPAVFAATYGRAPR